MRPPQPTPTQSLTGMGRWEGRKAAHSQPTPPPSPNARSAHARPFFGPHGQVPLPPPRAAAIRFDSTDRSMHCMQLLASVPLLQPGSNPILDQSIDRSRDRNPRRLLGFRACVVGKRGGSKRAKVAICSNPDPESIDPHTPHTHINQALLRLTCIPPSQPPPRRAESNPMIVDCCVGWWLA